MNNNNTTYKDSPLGKIPGDWDINSFGSVCEKLLDGTHFSPQSKDGPYKYITSKNIRNDGLDLTNVNYVSEKEHTEIYKRCPVMFNDVLLTKDGAGTGTCCKNTLTEEFSLLSSVAVLRVNREKIYNEFLIHFIKSPIGQKIIHDEISGQAITRITLEKIKSFRIITPPLPEQKAIAHVLGLLDTAINTNSQLIANKELQKKWLMQQLLSEKLIVKNEKWCKSGMRKVTIGEIAKIHMGQSPDSDYYNETRAGLPLIQGNADLKNRLSFGRIFTTHITKTCDRGDIIMTVRAPVGTIGIATKKSCIGRGVCALKPINVDPSYFYYLLLNNEKTWKRLEQGSTFTAVNSTDIFHFSFFIINSPEEQTAIARVLKAADKEIQLLKAKTERLREQKKGLMQVLLTGKKRLLIETQ